MQRYDVGGMSCAACSSRVQKAVSAVSGVSSCSVNLLTGSMQVEGSAAEADVIKAVVDAGYTASVKGERKEKSEDALADRETPVLLRRFLSSLVFLIILMYFSMGHSMWGAPLPKFFAENPMALGLVQLLLSAIVMIINQKFFISGVKGLLNKAPNMDTLVSLGSGASFIYSVYALFLMSDAMAKGNISAAHHYLHELYFESAAMILALITVGKMFEAMSKGKTTNALKSLMNLAPETAILIKDEKEVITDISQVRKEDVFIVKAGSRVPVDGIIISGGGAVDESALTGESIPADKAEGDSVSAGTTLLSGFIKCSATKVGEDTTLSQIISMVSDAAASKAPVSKAADKVSGIFVPAVLTIAAITSVVWLLIGESIGFALARGISVLVISCPCALGLATPVAIMVGSGVGAKGGILFKTAQALEETGKADIVALDKTGTITKGEPEVCDVIAGEGIDERKLFEIAYSLEIKSEHPLAKAIVKKGEELKISHVETEDFDILPGNGLCAKIAGEQICGGNYEFISKYTAIDSKMKEEAERLSGEGKTPMFFSKGRELCGIIAVADALKEDSIKAIKELGLLGIKTVMITGDNEKTANAIGARVGIRDVFASVLPGGKEEVIKKLKKEGKVIMVGDGINDAPALTRADIGIAIGAGEDVAIDAAEVVLMKNKLSDVTAAIRLSRATLKNIYENLFWAFIYNMFGIPLAAGVFIATLGWKLSPMFGAAAMSMSSFCVVMNALRLNFADIKNPDKYRHKLFSRKRKELKTMKITLKIEGMMCPHCEGRVKDTLQGIEGVTEAIVSHESGTAEVLAVEGTDAQVLSDAVVAQGYKVIGIE